MGASQIHRRKFLVTHPLCAFCGGAALATTIEHCPPRALFQDYQWPEGFEFPSCAKCNNGTTNHDLLVAMIARMDPITERGDRDGKTLGLMKAANRQFPGMFQRMLPSASDARRKNRELGIHPSRGQTHQEAGGINITEEMHQAVCVLATKLSKGIYYKATQNTKIFPNAGCLLLTWFSNADLIRDGRYALFEALQEVNGITPQLARTRKFLNDQFEYKLSFSDSQEVFILQARFGNSFGFVVFGSILEGRLESMMKRLREQHQKQGPFSVLQSGSLAEEK